MHPIQSGSIRRHLAARMLASALSLGGGALAGAAVLGALPTGSAAAAVTAPTTVTGKVVKVVSSHSFTMQAGSKHYVVKLDAMTHLKLNGKSVMLTALHVGDTVTVKGPLEMGEITASSVTATGM